MCLFPNDVVPFVCKFQEENHCKLISVSAHRNKIVLDEACHEEMKRQTYKEKIKRSIDAEPHQTEMLLGGILKTLAVKSSVSNGYWGGGVAASLTTDDGVA